jgi:uncharacterized protein (DUF885 family)
MIGCAVRRATIVSFACLLLIVGAVGGVDAQPSPPETPQVGTGSGDAALATLARTYLYANLAESPSGATPLGEHRFDAHVDRVTPAAIAAQLARDRRLLADLATLDPAGLSPDAALDRRLLSDGAHDDLLINGTLAAWRHNPDQYTGTASELVFALVERDFAPLAQRARDVIARERGIPALLAQGDANITTVDATTREIALDNAKGAVEFFHDSVPEALAPLRDPALRAAFTRANAAVVAALRRHVRFIEAIRPRGTFAIGASAYRDRLRYEDGLDISVAQYLAVGQRAFEATRAQFIATSRRIDPHRTPAQNYAELTLHHPKAAQLHAAAAADLKRLRAFIIAKHIVTLPRNASILVRDTPSFQRSTVTAESDNPGPLERVANQAYYYVTPVDPAWPAARKAGFLEQFNDFQRPIISAHEVYPGHFTHFALGREQALSLTRQVNYSSVFAEGWAHYSEQMMVDEGWGNGDPRVRLAQLDEALLRNCRFIVGVQLHTGGWTIPQAERFFTDRCFQPQATAIEESLRGAVDPMYGYYTLGKLMILKLRDDYRRKMGDAYSLQAFHDALLDHGGPPVPYVRPLLLGPDDDGKPLPTGS